MSVAQSNVQPREHMREQIADINVSLAVENELRVSDAVPAHLIDVSVEDGVATLEGSVNTLLSKVAAARVARATRGVTGVVNLIDVAETNREDSEIREDVTAALLADPAADSYEINVSVNDGRVTLRGTVESWSERDLAERVSRGVVGVQGIDNRIDVAYASERPDAEVAADVRRSIEASALTHVDGLQVSVEDGNVTLAGTVGSAAERWEARRLAWVAGADTVDSTGLTINAWDISTRRDARTKNLTDSQIKRALISALARDPRVMSFNPDVQVEHGRVTLTGTVDDLAAKHAAQKNAMRIAGVTRVHNYLRVRPDEDVTEQAIQRRVRAALLRDPYVNRYDLTVSVDNGKVTLWGDVDTEFERVHAAAVAARTSGVSEVDNNLVAASEWTGKEDWAIQEDVRNQLFWSPFVDADDVTVMVRDGVATLTGTVESWGARRAATENAYEAGARRVDNDLIVSTDG